MMFHTNVRTINSIFFPHFIILDTFLGNEGYNCSTIQVMILVFNGAKKENHRSHIHKKIGISWS